MPYPSPEPPLQREDGAKFTATIQTIEEGFRASYGAILDVGNETLHQHGGPELFATEREATDWLDAKARLHGFTRYFTVRE